MTPKQFHTLDATGVTVGNPPPETPGRTPKDYQNKPVRVSVHRDLTIELHGVNFSASAHLTVDEAMGLAMMLMLGCRDGLHALQAQPTVMVHVQ